MDGPPLVVPADGLRKSCCDKVDDDEPVLRDAYRVMRHNSTTAVSLNRDAIKSLASSLISSSSNLPSPLSWADEPLHPIPRIHGVKFIADWVFVVSLLNFSFWSDIPHDPNSGKQEGRYAVIWKLGMDGKCGDDDKRKDWTGYWALPAAINRALEEDVPITNPGYWVQASDEQLAQVFRGSTASIEGIPLLEDRIRLLREAGTQLCKTWEGSFYNLFMSLAATNSHQVDALSLVKLIVATFPAFRDESIHPHVGRVRLWKRAQILVAELWAALSSCPDNASFPQITGIDALTMFADYRVPQILHDLDLLTYSPHLHSLLSSHTTFENGSLLEIQIRAASIVAVEELRKAMMEIQRTNEEGTKTTINAVLLDFWLWNTAKDRETARSTKVECHRTRSIWY